MKCDYCGEEKGIWGHAVCADCYLTKKQDQIAKLKHQLVEKDKEIEELRDLAVGFEENFTYTLNQKLQLEKENRNLRHEICEKIRAYFEVNDHAVDFDYLNEILNEIEQGERK